VDRGKDQSHVIHSKNNFSSTLALYKVVVKCRIADLGCYGRFLGTLDRV